MVNIITFSYVPVEVYLFLKNLFYSHRFFKTFLSIIGIVPFVFELGHPILIVYYLGKRDRYFKQSYDRIFKRTKRDYADCDSGVEEVIEEFPNAEAGDENIVSV